MSNQEKPSLWKVMHDMKYIKMLCCTWQHFTLVHYTGILRLFVNGNSSFLRKPRILLKKNKMSFVYRDMDACLPSMYCVFGKVSLF